MANTTVLVTGFAQAPKGTSLYEQYKTIGVVLVVDVVTDEIEDAWMTFVSPLTSQFFVSIVRGRSLADEADAIQAELRQRLWIPSQGACIQAFRSASERYREMKQARMELG